VAKTKQKFPHAQDDKDYAKALKDLKMFAQELDNTFNEGSDEQNMIELFDFLQSNFDLLDLAFLDLIKCREDGEGVQSGAYASMMGVRYKNLCPAAKEFEGENSSLFAEMLLEELNKYLALLEGRKAYADEKEL
jgi:hypothetical protein